MLEEIVNGCQVMSDGRRVWVNSTKTGASVARFNVFGKTAMVDVHREPHEQAEKGECLDCEAGECSIDLWERFKRALLKHYNVAVSDKHRPLIFDEAKPTQ